MFIKKKYFTKFYHTKFKVITDLSNVKRKKKKEYEFVFYKKILENITFEEILDEIDICKKILLHSNIGLNLLCEIEDQNTIYTFIKNHKSLATIQRLFSGFSIIFREGLDIDVLYNSLIHEYIHLIVRKYLSVNKATIYEEILCKWISDVLMINDDLKIKCHDQFIYTILMKYYKNINDCMKQTYDVYKDKCPEYNYYTDIKIYKLLKNKLEINIPHPNIYYNFLGLEPKFNKKYVRVSKHFIKPKKCLSKSMKKWFENIIPKRLTLNYND